MDVALVLIIVTMVLLFAISRAAERAAARQDPVRARARRAAAEADVIARTESSLTLFRRELDPAKLELGNERYTEYYCGYIDAMAATLARRSAVEYSERVRAPVLREVSRLCGSGAQDAEEGGRLLPAILLSAYAKAGADDGRADADKALEPGFQGPYWENLEAYFLT